VIHPVIAKISSAIEDCVLGTAEGFDLSSPPLKLISKDQASSPVVVVFRKGTGKSKRAKRNDPLVIGHIPTRGSTWRDVYRLRRFGSSDGLRRKATHVNAKLSTLTKDQLDRLAELHWQPRERMSIVDRIAKLG